MIILSLLSTTGEMFKAENLIKVYVVKSVPTNNILNVSPFTYNHIAIKTTTVLTVDKSKIAECKCKRFNLVWLI